MSTSERSEQKAVIKFLSVEGVSPKEIHDRLTNVYNDAFSLSSVKSYVNEQNSRTSKISKEDRKPGNSLEKGIIDKKPLMIQIKKNAPKAHIKCVLVKPGTCFTDGYKNEFEVREEIGQGGFGRIYDGRQNGAKQRPVAIKMEPMQNGPLFTEMHVYHKILKEEHLSRWKKDNGLSFIGLPSLISSGKFTYEREELRYIVIPRYNDSIESALERTGTLSCSNIVKITKCVLHAYEYLHSQNYVHADVKGSNLLMETDNDFEHVVLIDFGLARKLPETLIEKEDKKSAHNGTSIFTSCDAHRGCLPSYRGDLEILAHNMLFWLTGSLPWKDYENDCPRIFELKKNLIESSNKQLPKLVKDRKARSILTSFYQTVLEMDFADNIDFEELFQLL